LLPAGDSREKERYLNTYPAVWMAGGFDYASAAFTHGELHELDAGFEFYAPQTMQTADGRRLLVGWMGVPDGEEMRQPTRANGWIHQMTCLRELEWVDGKLYQRPLRELSALRGEAAAGRATFCRWRRWKSPSIPPVTTRLASISAAR
jgi:beta-fructofuranosidase